MNFFLPLSDKDLSFYVKIKCWEMLGKQSFVSVRKVRKGDGIYSFDSEKKSLNQEIKYFIIFSRLLVEKKNCDVICTIVITYILSKRINQRINQFD